MPLIPLLRTVTVPPPPFITVSLPGGIASMGLSQPKLPFSVMDADIIVSERMAVILEVWLNTIFPFSTSASIGPEGTITIWKILLPPACAKLAVYFNVLVMVSLLMGNTSLPFALPSVSEPLSIDTCNVSRLALMSATLPMGNVMMLTAFTFMVTPKSSINVLVAVICVGLAPVFQVSGNVSCNVFIYNPSHNNFPPAEVSDV